MSVNDKSSIRTQSLSCLNSVGIIDLCQRMESVIIGSLHRFTVTTLVRIHFRGQQKHLHHRTRLKCMSDGARILFRFPRLLLARPDL